MTHVKICGITRHEDAALASDLGAAYLGFIFVKESPRYIDPEKAAEIISAVRSCGAPAAPAGESPTPEAGVAPQTTKFVGVFRNQPLDEVRRIARIAKLDLVQLHGDETYTLDLPTIKAFQVNGALPETNAHADYILFDTGGGTGRTFDWQLLAGYARSKPFFLAGGITPENVAEAIEATQPFAIDVASGVESAPGVKDPHKLRELFARIKQ
jgi:phosphoribosylanthranilate isomerase